MMTSPALTSIMAAMRHFLKQEMAKLGPGNPTLLFPEHHLSHAASAFYPSPFSEAAILTLDGVGEWATATIGHGQGKDLTILKELHFPHSLGLLYSTFTYYLGFKVNSSEYKLMGLAPYGDPDAEQTRSWKKLILNELVATKGTSVFFCDFSDLLDRIQASFGKGSDESQDDIVAPYRDAELLVPAELGARRPSDWVREVPYGLLNTRYNRGRLTILTTNFGDEPDTRGGETLEARVGAPVRSRLYEM